MKVAARHRDGINIGEAAVLFLMSKEPGRDSPIALLGGGASSDAYHISAPAPDGRGALQAMKLAEASGAKLLVLHTAAARVGALDVGAEDGDGEAVELVAGAGHLETARQVAGHDALAGQRHPALPTAAALLRLAPGLIASGHAVAAQDALPLYVRDKVAQTTAERESIRLAAEAGT